MYGSEKELRDMRDKVEDLRAEYRAQRKTLRRLIRGMFACAIIIAFSAVLNGWDMIPNGGNGGIIAVSVIAWISLIVGTIFFFDEKYDPDLASNLRKYERDLQRTEEAIQERPGA